MTEQDYIGTRVVIHEWSDDPGNPGIFSIRTVDLPYGKGIDEIDVGQGVIFEGERFVRFGFGHSTTTEGQVCYFPLLSVDGWGKNMEQCNRSLRRRGKSNPVNPSLPFVSIDSIVEN
ncbi:hypothetical protein HOC80_02645 [archaeon]|jgi:hypothetical protein|nr:hypothetical protein [archaeon]MBT4416979.1 hypothetical protein [archaeon]